MNFLNKMIICLINHALKIVHLFKKSFFKIDSGQNSKWFSLLLFFFEVFFLPVHLICSEKNCLHVDPIVPHTIHG